MNSVLTSICNAEFFNDIILDGYSKITACHFNEFQGCQFTLGKPNALAGFIFFS